MKTFSKLLFFNELILYIYKKNFNTLRDNELHVVYLIFYNYTIYSVCVKVNKDLKLFIKNHN